MGRKSTIWTRKGRGYWSTINRRQRYLGSNLKEAREKLKALLVQSRPTTVGQFTVAQLVALYLAELARKAAKEERSIHTHGAARSYLDRWAEACRRVRPEDVRVFHLEHWVESHEAWNSTTCANAIGCVKTFNRWAKRKGYLELNHLSDAIAPERQKRDPADPADLLKLESRATCPYFLDWFMVLYDTGCRPGELRWLESSRIDFKTSTALVRGKRGERVVGLSPRAVAILKRLALVYPDGPLLRTANGLEWAPHRIYRAWAKWRKAAGVPEDVIPYHARHDLPRRWQAAGISDLLIAKQMGHSSKGIPHIALLTSTYFHTDATSLAEAAQLASGASSKRSNRG